MLVAGFASFCLVYFLIMVGAARLADRSQFELAGSSYVFTCFFFISFFVSLVLFAYFNLIDCKPKQKQRLLIASVCKCLSVLLTCGLILSAPSLIISVLDATAGLILGASMSYMFISWIKLYSTKQVVSIASNMAIALMAASFIYTAVVSFESIFALCVVSVMAAVSEVLLCYTGFKKHGLIIGNNQNFTIDESCRKTKLDIDSNKAETSIKLSKISINIDLLQLMAIFFMLGFVLDNLRQLAFSSFNIESNLFDFAIITACAVLVCFLFIVVVFGFDKFNKLPRYRISIIVLPLVATSIVFLYYFEGASWLTYYGVSYITFMILDVYVWVLLCTVNGTSKVSYPWVVCLSAGFLFMGRFATSLVNNFALTTTENLSIKNAGEPIVVLFMLTLVLVLLIAASAFKSFFGGRKQPITQLANDDFSPAIKRAQIASNKYELTKREEEILVLLLEGRTYKGMSDLLFISINTIKTHSKNMYNKMGVHSKQELLELLDKLIDTN